MVSSKSARSAAFTMLDIVITITIIGILTAVSIPRAAKFLDSLSVHGAATDAFAVFSAARTTATSGAAQATVDIDTVKTTMIVRTGNDTILKRDLGLAHQVKISASRTSMAFSPTGLGYGAANLTLVLKRGAAVDSLFVSRLGRVRH